MSIWGSGNLDRDDARDELATLIAELIEKVRMTFTYDKSTSLYSDEGESQIMANIDIICTLCEHYNETVEFEISEVENWKTEYLQTYDRTIDRYYDFRELQEHEKEKVKQNQKERRVVIVDTFNKLRIYI